MQNPPIGISLMFRAARPRQWLKNALIFIPLAAAHAFESNLLFVSLAAFMVFCLCASSAYLLNDVLDIEHDRTHPRKKHRPIASGLITPYRAIAASITLGVCGLALAYSINTFLWMIASGYFVTTIVYSTFLKRALLIDVATLATLYTIRVFAGSAATGIKISFWLFAFSFFLFLSLALLKRHGELLRHKIEQSSMVPGRGYVPEDDVPVAVFGISCGMLSVLVLLLYYNFGEIHSLYPSPVALLFIVPLYFIWLARLWFLSFRRQIEEDPLLFVSTDMVSVLMIVMCAALAVLAAH